MHKEPQDRQSGRMDGIGWREAEGENEGTCGDKKRQPLRFTCELPEGVGDGEEGRERCMKTACKKDLR